MIAGYINFTFENPNQDIPNPTELQNDLIQIFNKYQLPIPKIEFCEVYQHPKNPLVIEFKSIPLPDVQRTGETSSESESTISPDEPGINPEN